MKTISVRTKLTVTMLAICLAGMIFTAGLSVLGARSLILNETLGRIKNEVSTSASSISGWLDSQKMLVQTSAISLVLTNDMDMIRDYCIEQSKSNSHLLDMYMGFSDDTGIFGNSYTDPGWKATQRPWYQAAMAKKGEIVVTSPYQDSQTGSMCITVTQYAGKINGLDAVMAIDVEIDTLVQIVENMGVSKYGYAFLADQDGLIITHPENKYSPTSEELYNMSYDEGYAKVYQNRNDESIKINDYDDATRYIVPSPVESSGWVLYAAENESEIFAKITNQTVLMLLLSAAIMIISALVIRMVIKKIIVKPVSVLTNAANHIINGDFNVEIYANSNDEIGMAVKAFEKVKNTINMVTNDMSLMTEAHKQGDYEYMLNDSQYTGSYKNVVSGVNSMVGMYVDNISGIMNLLQKVGNGDFNAQVKQYPGKQAVYNEIIEDFQSKLLKINSEINQLGEAAANGNLSARAQTSEFEGGWLKIITGLNAMLNAVSEPIKESVGVLSEMVKGNLSAKIKGDYKGDFANIKNSMNEMSSEISSYISEINHILNELANNNNLNISIKRVYIGDFTSIKDSINSIVNKLRDFIGEIANASNQVSDESRQVSDGAMILAQGSTEQAKSVEDLTKTIDAIDGNSKVNAENAKSANNLSIQSKDNAHKASEDMREMLHSIQEIKDASQNISKIVKVIEDIAFQTNLLALNAAVEAAHAGNHGKGFMVVAEEVRTLAGRSKKAADETNAIIEDTINKMNVGVSTAMNTADSLETIIVDVTEVSKIVDEIFNSSKKQSSAVAEVVDGLKNITQVVLSNTSTSEELASASEELLSQSDVLNNMIDIFHLN